MSDINPRILYIIGQLRRGGAEQLLYYLLKHLRPQAQVVALSQGGYWADPIRDLGIEVIELQRKGSWDLSRLFAITRITRRYRPDIVDIFLDNTPGLYGRLAALLTGNFRVITGELAETALQPHWYRMLKRLMNRTVSAVVCNSEANCRYLVSHRIAREQDLFYIPNGLELDLFADESTSNPKFRLWPDGRERIVIGTVGSLTPVKAPEVFVRTAARVLKRRPDVGFVHVGDGPLKERMMALSRELNIEDSFMFLGQYEDVVPQLLEAWDIFVLTSNSEGLPNAVMEAMAAGLACVVTDAGGCREIVRDGETGFVVPIGSDEDLADRILLLLQDEALRRRMGSRGRKRMQEFGVQQMAERYRQLYCKVLSKK